jgi:glycosyltransferase involved in cell wall biosynthesis
MQGRTENATRDRVRVTVLTTSFPVDGNPASGIFVARLVNNLPAEIDVEVVTPALSGCGGSARRGRALVSQIRYAPGRWEVLAHLPGGIPAALHHNRWLYLLLPGFLAGMFWATLRSARRSHVLHANWAICGFIAGLATRCVRRPLVTTLRGGDVERALHGGLSGYVLRRCVAWSDCLVAVGGSVRRSVIRMCPESTGKIVVIENGLDDEFFELAPATTAPSTPGSLKVVTVGSLIAAKDVACVLRALARLVNYQGIVLDIVGAGGEEPALRTFVESRGLKERVVFSGAVTPDRVIEHLARADAFVLASRAEGRPNALMEAMAMALPVIGSSIPAIGDLITHGKTGLLFEPGDDETLALHFIELSQSLELRRRLGDEGRALLLDGESRWRDTGTSYGVLYRQLLAC